MPRMGALALVLFALPGMARGSWQCETAHFRIISESGPETVAPAAEHLEAVRQRLADLALPLEDEAKGPTIVLLFANRESLNGYSRPDARDSALTRGLSLAGEERNWIAVVWDAPGSPLPALAHEYAHLISRDIASPLWFREGFAEYLSEIGSGGRAELVEAARLNHLRLLQDHPWSPWHDFVGAGRMSAVFARPSFYSQAWLVIHWLRDQGIAANRLRPSDFAKVLQKHGSDWVQEQLSAYAAELWVATSLPPNPPEDGAADPGPVAAGAAGSALEIGPTEPWELPFFKADFHRELQHWDRARPVLERLEREYPEIPEPSEALAGVAIAQGDYDRAEEKLRDALRKGSQRPSTYYRYSLMLMRPVEERDSQWQPARAEDRIRLAVLHARRAREVNPLDPDYLLAEAQALGLAGIWDRAADRLLELMAVPGWGERSGEEFAELIRRRQQTLRSVPAPEAVTPGASGIGDAGPRLAASVWNPPLSEVPLPPPPPTPEPPPWPPPGTVLLYGYINGVECLPDSKIITVKTPRYAIELREAAASPARLYHPPKGWAALPCGLRGYEVNVAYRPLPAGENVQGELVAVVF